MVYEREDKEVIKIRRLGLFCPSQFVEKHVPKECLVEIHSWRSRMKSVEETFGQFVLFSIFMIGTGNSYS